MRKIRLDVDALAVETFSPADDGGTPAGTVHARQDAAADIPTLDTGYHGCYACPRTIACAADVPTLDTGYHGCYACPASVACQADTPLCPDTGAGG